MEELTGRQCAILGNNWDYGPSFPIEMSKSNLQSGDIVILEFQNQGLHDGKINLLLAGMGKRYDMYRFLYPGVWKQITEGFPSFLRMSFDYWKLGGYKASGAYSMEAYDWRGNMIFPRDECMVPYPFTEEVAKTYGYRKYGTFEIEPEFKEYLNEYVQYCEKQNVKVYLTHDSCLDEAVMSTLEQADLYDQSIRDQINTPLISKRRDYIFPREYVYDFIGHCNETGTAYRTKLLYEDLLPYLSQ